MGQRAATEKAAPSRAGLDEIVAAMEGVRPGDVLVFTERKPGGPRADDKVAVISKSQRKKGDVRLRAVTVGRRLVSLVPRDFRSPPRVVDRLPLPAPYDPKSKEFRRRVAISLARSVAVTSLGATPAGRAAAPGRGAPELAGPEMAGPEMAGPEMAGPEMAGHPVASCPSLPDHLRAAARAERLARQVERLEKQVLGRTGSLALQFDRVLQLLERWGYVKGWALTAAGERLARIYHEQDLLVAECAERGLFDGLKVPEMAGLASVFTYEARGPAPVAGLATRWPSGRPEERWQAVQTVARELSADEEAIGVPVTRAPDSGFCRPGFRLGAGPGPGPAAGAAREGPPGPGSNYFCRGLRPQRQAAHRPLAPAGPGPP